MTERSCGAIFGLVFALSLVAYFLFKGAILGHPWWLYALIGTGAVIIRLAICRFELPKVGLAIVLLGLLALLSWLAHSAPAFGMPMLFAVCVVFSIAVILSVIQEVAGTG